MIMSCTEVGPLFLLAEQGVVCASADVLRHGTSRGMAILRGATCSARHYHTLTLGYTTWRWRGIHTYTLLIFPLYLLQVRYPCKLTRKVLCEVCGCPWPLAAGS